MPAFPPVFLLRHGETEWNKAARLQGHLDSPLTAKGKQQAAQQGFLLTEIFESYPDAHILCSPQGRAQKTAQIALSVHDRTATPCNDLREITAGSWDGLRLSDIAQSHGFLVEQARNSFELMFLAPDGEGQDAVLARAERVLAQLRGPSVLITHGATLCVLRGVLRGLAFEEMLDLDHAQGCIYAIKSGEEIILE